MIYVIDNATNRVIYQVPEGGTYFVDENSYELVADEVEFVQESHKYRWNSKTKTFDYAVEPKVVSVYPMPTVAPPPREAVGNMIVTEGIQDQISFDAAMYRHKLKEGI